MTETARKFELHPTSISCGSVHLHSVRPGTELEAAEAFMLDPAVEYAEPDYLIFAATVGEHAAVEGRKLEESGVASKETQSTLRSASDEGTPNDPFYDRQWALAKIEAEAAWKVSTGSNVIVAVIDSGVDLDHPELSARVLEGYDFVNGDTVADDDYGHGTLVAGVVAAAAHNERGIAGLAWDAQILPVKVLDNQGQGVSSNLTCALYWAANEGADVINISIISFGPSFGMQSAINYAANEGALIFSASGNLYEQGNPVTYPAALDNVIAVGATDKNDAHAWFSSAGTFVDVAAPGVGIYSPFPPTHEEYRSVNGTSLATPHVVGLAALVLSAAPGLSSEEVEEVIQQSAVDLGDASKDDKFGHGRIDASAAMSLTISSLPVHLLLPSVNSPAPTETPTVTPSPTADTTSGPTPTPSPTSTPSPTPTRSQ
ncbi:MAG: S8 family serine peptidase [Caldilineaceae bacterium]|nr:S8 family serine peptidase [Caldilineaceae bacterium]